MQVTIARIADRWSHTDDELGWDDRKLLLKARTDIVLLLAELDRLEEIMRHAREFLET